MPEDVKTQFEDLLEKVEKYLSHLNNRYKVLREQFNGYEDKYHPTCIIVNAKLHECEELRDKFMSVFENFNLKSIGVNSPHLGAIQSPDKVVDDASTRMARLFIKYLRENK